MLNILLPQSLSPTYKVWEKRHRQSVSLHLKRIDMINIVEVLLPFSSRKKVSQFTRFSESKILEALKY